jgi:molybdenum cofactor biosynthesis enzyme MoaA
MAENFKSPKKNYCDLPFNHTVVNTQGNFMPCCHHYIPKSATVNIESGTYEQWVNGDYMRQVQQAFELDQRHPGCTTCWQLEDRGFASPRTRSQKEYKILKAQDFTNNLTNIEIQLGNLCNLKCLMCDETGSSQILAENQKLKIAINDQREFNWSDQACASLRELILSKRPKVLTLRGGEPLYNPKLLELIQNLPVELCRNMMLIMVTNATVWSDVWADVLSKFRLVKFVLSIDAIGELYEYIRFPAAWHTVENNVDQIMHMPRTQHSINAVVQNLNINRLGELIHWSMEKKIYLHLNDIIKPDYLQVINLPEHLRQQSLNHLSELLAESLPGHLNQYVSTLHHRIKSHSPESHDHELWKEFQHNIGMRDALRGNSHRKFMLY